LEFDPAAFDDLAWWIATDRRTALRIVKLVEATQRDRSRASASPSR
jgi:toxin YoeB